MGKYRKHDISTEWLRTLRKEIEKVEDTKQQGYFKEDLLRAYNEDSMHRMLTLSEKVAEYIERQGGK